MKTSLVLITACLVGVYNGCYAANMVEEIYEGEYAVLGQFPYGVYMIFTNMEGGSHLCGGALISDTWVLTAAHCIENANYTDVYAGILKREELEGGQYSLATHEDFYMNPNFDSDSVRSDMGLIKLKSPFTFNDYVSAIDLPPKSDASPDSYLDTMAVVSGWGLTNDTSNASNDLLYKNVEMTSLDKCEAMSPAWTLDVSMICSVDGGTCPGDSGSPLVTNGRDGKLKVIGVVSFGTHCYAPDPDVYGKVAVFLDWISDITGIEVN